MSYNFSTLNDKDLEELALDILSRKLSINFQAFKMGSDKGIDLRYATSNNENEIIVQVKHYLNSGLSKLERELEKNELKKVKKLAPSRYILITSLPLNPMDKERLKEIFDPFIISTNDILGKDELNYFIRNNKDIEEAHFKLWLSSTNVLNRILHNGLKGRNEFFETKIKDRIKIFVPNKTHSQAVEILNKHNFILITGAPGIGKSTLANMLTYQLLAADFELIYVREIREAEDLYESEKKQVFYFDDFLGSITLDLQSSKNADSAIVNFIDRIKRDSQKRIILTCRTTILNQAKRESEKIDNFKTNNANYEVKIEDYRDIDKAKILYNHIYFSNLSFELQDVFFKDNFYWEIIRHKHYNPRIIEFFTDADRIQPNVEYRKQVIEFLNSPAQIWEKHYSIQISEDARFFLSTLYSLDKENFITEKKLIEAFDARLTYEVNHNNYKKTTDVFNTVIKELLGGFITRIYDDKDSSVVYKFLNPSVEDFLYQRFVENIDEYFVILKSAIYFEQFKKRITTKQNIHAKKINFNTDNYSKLLAIFIDRIPNLKSTNSRNELETIIILLRLFDWNDIQDIFIEIMNRFDYNGYLGWDDRENLIEILSYISDYDRFDYFSLSIDEILLSLSRNINYHFQIESFSLLISKHKVYRRLIENAKLMNEEFINEIQENIDQAWNRSIDYYINKTGINTITEKEELIAKIDKLRQDAKEINEALNIEASPIIDEYNFDLENRLKENISRNSAREIAIKTLETNNDQINEPLEINRLFNSFDTNKWANELPF